MGSSRVPGPQGTDGKPVDLNDGTKLLGLSPLGGPTHSPSLTTPAPVSADVAHHDVVRGDSLWSIAAAALGNGALYADLAQLNHISTLDPLRIGQRLIVPDYRRCDLTVDYMLGEMLKNARSSESQAAAEANQQARTSSSEADKAFDDLQRAKWYEVFRASGDRALFNSHAQQSGISELKAMAIFWGQVHAGGPWDHKPILQEKYKAMPSPPRPFGTMNRWLHFPIRGDLKYEYYYDVWSNIHYGFVGTRCGFSESVLQKMAGSGTPLAGDNDEGDVLSIRIGIDLWNRQGLRLTAKALCSAITGSAGIYLAARAREIAAGTDPSNATNVVITNNDYK